MPIYIYLSALGIIGSIPLLIWAFGGVLAQRRVSASTLTPTTVRTDLRDTVLARPATERLLDPLVERLAGFSRRLAPSGARRSLDLKIQQAGFAGRVSLDSVLVAKTALLAVFGGLGTLTWLAGPSVARLVLALLLGTLAWFAPDLILYGRAVERQRRLGEELPEVLDQMTVTVEAGLAFEAALARVVQEGGTALSEEFGRALQDIRLGVPRERALMRVIERNNSRDLKHFVLALSQADRLGVPLANVLRVLADEMREQRRTLAQEKAMKVPAKLVFPVVLCVLPALFVAILGPAFVRLFHDGILG